MAQFFGMSLYAAMKICVDTGRHRWYSLALGKHRFILTPDNAVPENRDEQKQNMFFYLCLPFKKKVQEVPWVSSRVATIPT